MGESTIEVALKPREDERMDRHGGKESINVRLCLSRHSMECDKLVIRGTLCFDSLLWGLFLEFYEAECFMK